MTSEELIHIEVLKDFIHLQTSIEVWPLICPHFSPVKYPRLKRNCPICRDFIGIGDINECPCTYYFRKKIQDGTYDPFLVIISTERLLERMEML